MNSLGWSVLAIVAGLWGVTILVCSMLRYELGDAREELARLKERLGSWDRKAATDARVLSAAEAETVAWKCYHKIADARTAGDKGMRRLARRCKLLKAQNQELLRYTSEIVKRVAEDGILLEPPDLPGVRRRANWVPAPEAESILGTQAAMSAETAKPADDTSFQLPPGEVPVVLGVPIGERAESLDRSESLTAPGPAHFAELAPRHSS